MDKVKKELNRIKVDALYGKKKHFNAADRKEKYHLWIGIPLIIITALTSSVLFYVIAENYSNGCKYFPLVLSVIATILSSLQTFLNFQKTVEQHRRIANDYLVIMKRCNRIGGHLTDMSKEELICKIECLAEIIDRINREAANYSTSKKDYEKAQKGVAAGEEEYTDEELNA